MTADIHNLDQASISQHFLAPFIIAEDSLLPIPISLSTVSSMTDLTHCARVAYLVARTISVRIIQV